MSTDTAARTGRIRPEIAHLAVPIDTVSPYPGNPRRGNHDVIAASLTEHGQYKPLLVQDSTGYLVAGNNTWHVMNTLGWKTVAVLRIDVDDNRARAMSAVDNKSTDGAEYDDAALAMWLDDLPDLSGTGWTREEIDDLLRATDTLGNAATAFIDPFAAPAPTAPAPTATAPAAGFSHATAPAETPTSAAPGVATVTTTTTLPGPHIPGTPMPPGPTAAEPAYVQVIWTVTPAAREIIRAAIRHAQDQLPPATTQADALVHVCSTYSNTVTEEAP